MLDFAPFLAGIASRPMTVALIITAALVASSGWSSCPMQDLALFGVDRDDAGAASALVNASRQIGGSLGIALF
ncbi:MAG: MFS transporter, partial [Arthrobacter sp.]